MWYIPLRVHDNVSNGTVCRVVICGRGRGSVAELKKTENEEPRCRKQRSEKESSCFEDDNQNEQNKDDERDHDRGA